MAEPLPQIPGLRIVEEVGRGGMGRVFRAHDEKHGRIVAVKILSRDLARTPELSARFEREAKALARIEHSNIATLFGSGEWDGHHFLVMRYVEGIPLGSTRLSVVSALEAVASAARTIEYAHGRGVLHRDIKPSNLMQDGSGRVIVLDFGLARTLADDTTLTATGCVLGTPAYMSPEQASGLPVDERSDVYGLGATLYTLLTHRPPFEGTTPLELVRKVADSEPIPPRQLDDSIPAAVEAIVLRALEKAPADRYASAETLADDIERFLRRERVIAKERGPLSRLVRRVRRQPAVWGLSMLLSVALVALMVMGLGGLLSDAVPSKPDPTAQPVEAVVWDQRRIERISVCSSGAEGDADSHGVSLSADGRWIVFSSDARNLIARDDNGVRDVFLHDRRSGSTVLVSIADDQHSQARSDSMGGSISADGRWIAFWSHDAHLAGNAKGIQRSVYLYDRDRGRSTLLNVAPGGVAANQISLVPRINADGTVVAFESYASNLDPRDRNSACDIYVWDASDRVPTCISLGTDGKSGNDNSTFAVPSADGRVIAFHSQARNLTPDPDNGAMDVFVHDRLSGMTECVSRNRETRLGNGDSVCPALSGDGRVVAFSSSAANLVEGDDNGHDDVFVADRGTGTLRLISVGRSGRSANGGSTEPHLSGDGRFLVFESVADDLVEDDTNGVRDVFVFDLSSGRLARVSVSETGEEADGESSGPSISADGRFILFTSNAKNLVPGKKNAFNDAFVALNPLAPPAE